MNCPYCGGEPSLGAAFCRVCGTPIFIENASEENSWGNKAGAWEPHWESDGANLLPDSPGEVAYEPPEGYAYDEQSGLYIQEAIAVDDAGNEMLWTHWFDPVTGKYTRRNRVLREHENSEPVKAEQRKGKKFTSIAAVAAVVIAGTVAAQAMNWISLPFLTGENSLATPEENLSENESTAQGDYASETDTYDAESTEITGTDFSSSSEETSLIESESASSDRETSAADDKDREGQSGMDSQQAIQIDTGLSSSPCPISSVDARYEGEGKIIITCSIAQDFQEHGTVLFTYGQPEGDSEEWVEDLLVDTLHALDNTFWTQPFGEATMEDELVIDDEFFDQTEYLYVFMFTYNADIEFVAHTVLTIDVMQLKGS